MADKNLDPKVDAYIAKAPAFAQPIMTHLRKLIHKGCPDIVETVKWSRPFFQYRGSILCYVAAFKAHCRFGFWDQEMGAVLREARALPESGADSLSRISGIKDLPSDKVMLQWIRQAAAFVDSGQYKSPIAARSSARKS